jgi:hypothetical protein
MLIDRMLGVVAIPPGDSEETVRMFGPRDRAEQA